MPKLEQNVTLYNEAANELSARLSDVLSFVGAHASTDSATATSPQMRHKRLSLEANKTQVKERVTGLNSQFASLRDNLEQMYAQVFCVVPKIMVRPIDASIM